MRNTKGSIDIGAEKRILRRLEATLGFDDPQAVVQRERITAMMAQEQAQQPPMSKDEVEKAIDRLWPRDPLSYRKGETK